MCCHHVYNPEFHLPLAGKLLSFGVSFDHYKSRRRNPVHRPSDTHAHSCLIWYKPWQVQTYKQTILRSILSYYRYLYAKPHCAVDLISNKVIYRLSFTTSWLSKSVKNRSTHLKKGHKLYKVSSFPEFMFYQVIKSLVGTTIRQL